MCIFLFHYSVSNWWKCFQQMMEIFKNYLLFVYILWIYCIWCNRYVSLTSIYALLYPCKLDFNISVLSLIWLFLLLIPRGSHHLFQCSFLRFPQHFLQSSFLSEFSWLLYCLKSFLFFKFYAIIYWHCIYLV